MSGPLPPDAPEERTADQAALLDRLRQGRRGPPAAPAGKRAGKGGWRGPSRRHLAGATRQLATLLAARVALVRALALVSARAPHPGLQEAFGAAQAGVQGGASLARALAARPGTFNRLYVNLVGVGEQAGLLPEVLHRLAVHLEQSEALRRKVRGALMYPAVILGVAAASTLTLLLKVIPIFAEMFRHSGVPLPVPTQVIIRTSEGLRDYGLFLVLAGAAALLAGRAVLAHAPARLVIDRLLLSIPLAGALLHQSALARFARNLSTLLAGGVPLMQALTATQETLMNRHLEQALAAARQAVEGGRTLGGALAGAPGWPEMVSHLIGVGEETGSLAPVLEHLAAYYSAETEHRVQALTTILEPLLIVLVALLVGGLLVAMYLPIFNLSEVVS